MAASTPSRSSLIQKIGRSDVLVLSVSFSPHGPSCCTIVKDSGDDRTMNMVSALVMAVKAFKKNVAKEVAQESGGEYTTFTGDKRFEQRVVDAARRHAQPISDHLQSFGSRLLACTRSACARPQDYGARIVARANYWLQPDQ